MTVDDENDYAACGLCGLSFKKFRRLRTHFEVMHPTELPDDYIWPDGKLIFFDEEMV